MITPTNGTSTNLTGTDRIEVAGGPDVHLLGRLIADAFADLEQNLWLVPDGEARPYVFPAYFALQVELGLQHGVVYTTRQRDAVAVWLPVHDAAPTLPDYHARLHRLAGSWTQRFLTLETALETHHPDLGRHEYLTFLAVHPARQRRGLGTQLLRHHDRILDQTHVPAYLEAANQQGRDFYCKHGWHPHGDPYLITPTGPAMHPMVRQPQPPVGHSSPDRVNGWA